MHYVLGILITVIGVAWSALVVMACGMSDVGAQKIDGSVWFGVAAAAFGLAEGPLGGGGQRKRGADAHLLFPGRHPREQIGTARAQFGRRFFGKE